MTKTVIREGQSRSPFTRIGEKNQSMVELESAISHKQPAIDYSYATCTLHMFNVNDEFANM